LDFELIILLCIIKCTYNSICLYLWRYLC